MVIICIKLDKRRSLPTSQKLKVLEEKIKIYFLNDWASELILSWVQVNVIYFFITKKEKKHQQKTKQKKTEKNVFLLPLQKKSCDRTEMYFSIFVYLVKVEKTQE